MLAVNFLSKRPAYIRTSTNSYLCSFITEEGRRGSGHYVCKVCQTQDRAPATAFTSSLALRIGDPRLGRPSGRLATVSVR